MSLLSTEELEDLRAEWEEDLGQTGRLERQATSGKVTSGAYVTVATAVPCQVSTPGGGGPLAVIATLLAGTTTHKQSAGRQIAFKHDQDVRAGDRLIVGSTTYAIRRVERDLDQAIGLVADADIQTTTQP